MRTEMQRTKAERFHRWVEANAASPRAFDVHTRRRLDDEEWSQPRPPVTRDEKAADLRLSYDADGPMFKRVVCASCGRTGTYYGSVEQYEELVPDPHAHRCDRCRGSRP